MVPRPRAAQYVLLTYTHGAATSRSLDVAMHGVNYIPSSPISTFTATQQYVTLPHAAPRTPDPRSLSFDSRQHEACTCCPQPKTSRHGRIASRRTAPPWSRTPSPPRRVRRVAAAVVLGRRVAAQRVGDLVGRRVERVRHPLGHAADAVRHLRVAKGRKEGGRGAVSTGR